ncbi:MAG TPA: DUF5752 family protein [bacterium]
MDRNPPRSDPFVIKDCALIAIATGRRVRNPDELKSILAGIDVDSIYYHFWGGRLRPRFDDPEYHNDFAIWARHGLHDKILSERLSLIDPIDFPNLEDLRNEIIEVIEERMEEVEVPPISSYDNQFEFIRSQIVIFDTNQKVSNPADFVDIMPRMSVGSVFYHFIDAHRRNENRLDDFQNWMLGLGKHEELCTALNEIDPYFLSLTDLRRRLTEVFVDFFK